MAQRNGDPVLPKAGPKTKAAAKPRAKAATKPKRAATPVNTGHGKLTLKLGWLFANRVISITGGPYDQYTPAEGSFGVCVRAERVPEDKVDVVLPIQDFEVPTDPAAVRDALKDTLEAALAGKQVYVGCMGGYGRTGLFLALLAKAAGVGRPIMRVRNVYHGRAVETAAQAEYVTKFNVRPLRWWLFWRCWQLWWKGPVA